jgi:transketolase
VPEEALAHFRQVIERGQAAQAEWQVCWDRWAAAHPEQAQTWQQMMSNTLPDGWDRDIPIYTDKPAATRNVSGEVLNAIANYLPGLIGGSADLEPSNKTALKAYPYFQADQRLARNFHFGVREHGMGGIINGMAVHGGLMPYGATFLVFSDYMRGSIRVAALSHYPIIYVFTHDSIGLGEDGPTHQPIEHTMALRLIPNLEVIRPADANETAAAWRCAIENRDHPTALLLTRQNVPVIDPACGVAEGVKRGAYVVACAPESRIDVILIGTGSEVSIALDAQKRLAAQGVAARVVSMPSWERFARQTQDYRDSVLPPHITARVSIEAGVTSGWQRWVGAQGVMIGIVSS